MANKQYESGYNSFAPADVHEVDMDRRADWNETDEQDPSYILNKPNVVSTETQSDWNETDNTKTAFIKNKPTIPDAQIQADWNQASSSAKDYIKNKPTIPTVPEYPAAGAEDATYVLKVAADGTISWVAAV